MSQMCPYIAHDPPVSVIDNELEKNKKNTHTHTHIIHDIPCVIFVTENMSILCIPFTGTEGPTG